MAKKSSKSHPQNVAYIAENRRERNALRDLRRHVKNFPNDQQAIKSLELKEQGKPGIKGKRKYVWKYKDDKGYGKGNAMFAFRMSIENFRKKEVHT